MDWIRPRSLRIGDTIGIVAPASNVKLDLLEAGCRELQGLGFKTYFRPDITSSFRYFAGLHERRRAEFFEMLQSPDIHAVFCARGGYGSGYLLCRTGGELARLIRANPKIICGSSDVTLLLNAVQQAGVVAFHGPMVATAIRRGTSGYDRKTLLDLIHAGARVRFPVDGTSVLRAGVAEGRLTGGCLSLVAATLGTRQEMDTRDSILILEDVDAKPYQIDRMLMQLKYAGKFDEVRGVIFGEMLNCIQHPDQGYSLQETLSDVLAEFTFPILHGFPTGHTSGPNVIVPFGVRARLELSSCLPAAPIFELLEPAVTLN